MEVEGGNRKRWRWKEGVNVNKELDVWFFFSDCPLSFNSPCILERH